MNNEDFFDIIGDIDDDIISDAMFPVRKKRGNIRRIISTAAGPAMSIPSPTHSIAARFTTKSEPTTSACAAP
ncbi:MAG: hypothetical protein IJA39_00280, partial [Clostridia bacterium]|nr:hypothetical protein [Clostridia bacterium]